MTMDRNAVEAAFSDARERGGLVYALHATRDQIARDGRVTGNASPGPPSTDRDRTTGPDHSAVTPPAARSVEAQAREDATELVAADYSRGMPLDRIADHHDDRAADLLSDAQPGEGQRYAREYARTQASVLAELRADEEADAQRIAAPPATTRPAAVRDWEHGGVVRDASSLAGLLHAQRGHQPSTRSADREAG
jgi:hypothetical protein